MLVAEFSTSPTIWSDSASKLPTDSVTTVSPNAELRGLDMDTVGTVVLLARWPVLLRPLGGEHPEIQGGAVTMWHPRPIRWRRSGCLLASPLAYLRLRLRLLPLASSEARAISTKRRTAGDVSLGRLISSSSARSGKSASGR